MANDFNNRVKIEGLEDEEKFNGVRTVCVRFVYMKKGGGDSNMYWVPLLNYLI